MKQASIKSFGGFKLARAVKNKFAAAKVSGRHNIIFRADYYMIKRSLVLCFFFISGSVNAEMTVTQQYEFCAIYSGNGALSACYVSMDICQSAIKQFVEANVGMVCVARPKER